MNETPGFVQDTLVELDPNSARGRFMAIDSSIRSSISEHEWLWMTDDQKANLERSACEPDY